MRVKCGLGLLEVRGVLATGTFFLSCLQDPFWDVQGVLLGLSEAFLRKRRFFGS